MLASRGCCRRRSRRDALVCRSTSRIFLPNSTTALSYTAARNSRRAPAQVDDSTVQFAFQGVDAETGRDRSNISVASSSSRRRVSHRFVGCTVARLHAASVALVAALTGCATPSAPAPCAVRHHKLVSEDGGATEIERRGDDNTGHITENHKSTFPWGFQHSKDAETPTPTGSGRGPRPSTTPHQRHRRHGRHQPAASRRPATWWLRSATRRKGQPKPRAERRPSVRPARSRCDRAPVCALHRALGRAGPGLCGLACPRRTEAVAARPSQREAEPREDLLQAVSTPVATSTPSPPGVFHVLSGSGEVEVGGATSVIERGDTIVIPSNTPHQVGNSPDSRADLELMVVAPAWEPSTRRGSMP